MAALVTVLGYFAIGLPVSMILSLKSREMFDWKFIKTIHGPVGLLIGINLALFIMNAMFMYIIYTQDWRQAARNLFNANFQYANRQNHQHYKFLNQTSKPDIKNYTPLLSTLPTSSQNNGLSHYTNNKQDHCAGAATRLSAHLNMQSECSIDDLDLKAQMAQKLEETDDEYACLIEKER